MNRLSDTFLSTYNMIDQILFTFILALICAFMIFMVYKIRSISKGPPSWIINLSVFNVFVLLLVSLVFAISFGFANVEG